MKTSQRFRQRARDVERFRDAFFELIKVMEEQPASPGSGITVMRPISGKENEARRLDATVSRLSGRAAIAARGHEQTIAIQVPGRGTTPVHVIQTWRYAIDHPFLLEPAYLLSGVDQVIGALEGKADEAEAREGTLAGKVAMFVGFPAAVRAAVVAEHSGLAKAAFTAGVIAQIFVAVAGGLLTVAATAGVAALWKQVVHSSPTPPRSQHPVTSVTGPAPTSPAPTPNSHT